jgi:hydroxyacylglutathione hydrolase
MKRAFSLAAVLVTAGLISCVPRAPRPVPFDGFGATRVLRTGPSQSMIYVANTSAGPIVIDLGWTGAKDSLRAALAEIGSDSSKVAGVFLTHAHRDHIEAWPVVVGAPFYLGAPESDFLTGDLHYRGWVPRTADAIKPPSLPRAGVLKIHEFTRDTAVVIGTDTIRAFLVSGHTPGSTAYVFRNILFAGDALTRTRREGFRSARARYSDDPKEAEQSLHSLVERIAPLGVRYICNAHARCTEFSSTFVNDVLGDHGQNGSSAKSANGSSPRRLH